MNKNHTASLMICLILTIILMIIIFSSDVIESVLFSFSIWKDSLFPTLFPFFVFSNLLVEYGFVDIIGKCLGKFMNKLFRLPGSCGFVVGASLFSGFPSGAKYTKDLVEGGFLNREDGARLLTFTHFSNPLFILGMIGTSILGNIKVSILILVSHIASGIIVGIILNGFSTSNNIYTNTSLSNGTSNKTLGEMISKSIMDSLNTMFLLLGIVTIFLIITTIINRLFVLPALPKALLAGLLEMTQGIHYLAVLDISLLLKVVLITFIISFGGLSVHMQVVGIISSQKIKYKPFLVARILHAFLASLFVFILYTLFYLL